MEKGMIGRNTSVLVTGANGFIGSKLVEKLIEYGFEDICCAIRPTSSVANLETILKGAKRGSCKIVKGNLLDPDYCNRIVDGVNIIFHCAAGTRSVNWPDMYLNTVVTTRNLLGACIRTGLNRFVNISSFAVYSNFRLRRNGVLDENCEIEQHHQERYESYSYCKVHQENIVSLYADRYGLPIVTVRPGAVIGPGGPGISGRIGTQTLGRFIHVGRWNWIPFTYVDNCAEAILMVGLTEDIVGETFNIVDDHLPTSRDFLRMYKKSVTRIKTIYMPYTLFYLISSFIEFYSKRSEGQIPPALNRRKTSAYFKKTRFNNVKVKRMTGWKPRVGMKEGLLRYMDYLKSIMEADKAC